MKKLLFTLMAIVAAISFSACSKDDGETWPDDSPIIEFKDSYFLEALVKSTDNDDGSKIDKNGDGRISEKEASVVKNLYVDDSGIRGIDEIGYFTALTSLSCGGNQLTSLDVSKNTALTSLSCGVNKLTSLDVSKNTALRSLDFDSNQITSLDVSKNTALTWLGCGGNPLTSLDVSKCKKLIKFNCFNNPSLKSIVIYKYYDSRLEYDLNTIIRKYGNIITYKE